MKSALSIKNEKVISGGLILSIVFIFAFTMSLYVYASPAEGEKIKEESSTLETEENTEVMQERDNENPLVEVKDEVVENSDTAIEDELDSNMDHEEFVEQSFRNRMA